MNDQLQPGPELNAAVARAIGWPYREWKDKRGRECCAWEPTTGGTIAPGLWRPSTDIADAMRALSEMDGNGAGWFIERRDYYPDEPSEVSHGVAVSVKGREAAELYNDHDGDRLAALCLAICRAVVEAGR